MRLQNLPLLLNVVESVFGKRVLSYTECKELSEAVFSKTGSTLNVSTLRRVFNVVPSKHSPSPHTLHTLARYCGYGSFDDLVIRNQEKYSNPQADSSLLKYLVLLFKDMEVPHIHDITYINLVKHTIQFLNQEPQLVAPFQKAIAKTKNGQDFYFEQFFNIDRLASFYGEGLHCYLAEKKTPEAQVFGYALLCNGAWLTADDDGLSRYFTEMTRYGPVVIAQPVNAGRYFGARLLKAKVEKQDASGVIREAKDYFHDKEANNPLFQQNPGFELTFATNLILACEWEEAVDYCDRGLKKIYPRQPLPANPQLFHAFYLFKALALAQLGKTAEALEAHQEIDVHQFYFLAKKYLTILYLHLQTTVRRGRGNELQIGNLVQETGFTRLLKPFLLLVAYAAG